MFKKSKEEIEEFAKIVWADSYSKYEQPKLEIEVSESLYKVTISKMYSAPGLSFAQLMQLAEFFGTTNINDDKFNYEGCETCDYGSEYGFTLSIRPEASISISDAVLIVFGGIGVASMRVYDLLIDRVAKLCGREVNDEFRAEVREEINNLPCQLD